MREPRNPFRLRASENIEVDATFVRLFGPGVLDMLKGDERLATRIIRSAAGGGKTSLLRLFTPGPLLQLHAHRAQEEYVDLFERMKGLGAISDQGPRLLGIVLSGDKNYAALADMELDASRQQRLLFALLDARLLLAMLREALALRRLDIQEHLDRLTLQPTAGVKEFNGLALPCTGTALYEWARNREDEICEAIDSFDMDGFSAGGSDVISSLGILKPEAILIDGEQVAERLLVMLDDVHKLTATQRRWLVTTVLSARNSTPVWIAERLEALSTDELLASGTTEGRDYETVLLLEDYWRRHPKPFERVVLNIADKRARAASSVEISAFGSCLQDSLDGAEWQPAFERALQTVPARIRERAGNKALFAEWISAREALEGTPRERVISWRALEILIERELRKTQSSFDFSLGVEDLEHKDDSSLKAAAELFLSQEYDLPYYFGSSTLSKLATSNIEQFLWLAGEEFEEVVSAAVINPSHVADLTPARQEALLKKAAKSLWDEIPRRAANGRAVRRFLEAIATFSRSYTFQPNAPNDPGVNGIAISMNDREKLLNPKYLEKNPGHAALAEVIASALAHNLIDADLDYKCKGERWMVLNLNRLLCVSYNLPLNYGKFKEKTLAELTKWLNSGFVPPKNTPTLL
ncbi:MAG: hypothetical protein ABI680_02825 [Chthoniobacteraceae bacterium]